MIYYHGLWAAVLLFAALHFGLIAVLTPSSKRAWLFGCLAVLAFLIGFAIIAQAAKDIRGLLFLTVFGVSYVATGRYKIGKKYDRKDFRIGKVWYLAPFVLELIAAAVLIVLYINSYLAAERLFDRLEREIAAFGVSPDANAEIKLSAPNGGCLLYFFPYTTVDEPDIPAAVNRELARIGGANKTECFALIDPVYGAFVRKKAWNIGRPGGAARVFRWDAAAGTIRVGISKDHDGIFVRESGDPDGDIRAPAFSRAEDGQLPRRR